MLSDFRMVVVGTGWALLLSGPATCSHSIRATTYPPWSAGGLFSGQTGPVAELCNHLWLNKGSGYAP